MARCGRAQLVPFVGIVVDGSHGERLELGVNEVLLENRLPPGACAEFRARCLEAFGPVGARVLEPEDGWDGFRQDGSRGLGLRPGSQIEDRELAAMFGRPR